MNVWILWLILCGTLLLLELFTASIASLCGACGCLAAFFVAIFGGSVEAQLIAAAVGTMASLIFLAPFVNRYRKKHKKGTNASKTNMEALIGRTAMLLSDITPDALGRLRIDGDNWQALSATGAQLEKGTLVKVTGYESIILLVTAAE